MKIESILRITGGRALNSPVVSNIENIQTLCSKVTRGSFFIDINNSFEDVQCAVENGAYAIISTTLHQIIDDEIAWIQTDDLQLSLIKLARYYAAEKELKFFKLSLVEMAIAKKIKLYVKSRYLSDEITTALSQILIANGQELFFVSDNSFIDKIAPSFVQTSKEALEIENFEKSIFLSTFTCKDKFFSEIKLPYLFLQKLCTLLEMFETHNIEYDVTSFANFEHFIPIFVDENLQKKEFGSSSKALIFESDVSLFEKESKFLLQKFKAEDTIFLKYPTHEQVNALKRRVFKYVLILGDIAEYESIFAQSNIQQLTLL